MVLVSSREAHSPTATGRRTAEEVQPAMAAAVLRPAVTVVPAPPQPARLRPAKPQQSGLAVAAPIPQRRAGWAPQPVLARLEPAGFDSDPPRCARLQVALAPC